MENVERRRPRVRLDRDRIVAAALDLIETEGLESLSARKVASRVGCEAMSLYNHVTGMDDLKDAIVDRLLASLPSVGGGRAALEAAARAYLQLAHDHANAFALVATRLWHTPNAVAAAAAMIGNFEQAGAGPRQALRHARILGAYLNGSGLALAAWRREASPEMLRRGGEVRADLDHGLVTLIDALLAK